jgi:ribosomal protein L37E
VTNPWNGQPITCRGCGNDTFKDAGRSLDTYNHQCAKCGLMNHTMTETGMSA